MRITVDPNTDAAVGEKTDVQLQDELLQSEKQKSLNQEARNLSLTEALSQPAPVLESRAHELKASLGGTFDERMREEKTILLTLSYGQRPEVTFTGFWNGKLVNNAMNAISRAYRVQRHKAIRANAVTN